MALGIEGSKGILHESIQKKEDDVMAFGFEGSKGILTEAVNATSCLKPRKEFQHLVFQAANRKLGLEEFTSETRPLLPRMSVSVFINNTCSLGCGHCYLRTRNMQLGELPPEAEIAIISNKLNAIDFSIVGMEPLEAWERTHTILELVNAKRKAIITNGMRLTENIATSLAKNGILVDFSIGEAKNYARSLVAAQKLRNAGVKATASCIVTSEGMDPVETIQDVSALGFPLVFFSCCDPSGSSKSDALLLNLIEDLRGRNLRTKVLIKVDFLSPKLLHTVWQKYFAGLEFSDLRIDLDEGFLVRELAPNLLVGAYPFPGEFINRARVDADGALTSCYHMQLPLNERLAVTGELRYQPDKWLEIPEILNYHKRYWENYFTK